MIENYQRSAVCFATIDVLFFMVGFIKSLFNQAVSLRFFCMKRPEDKKHSQEHNWHTDKHTTYNIQLQGTFLQKVNKVLTSPRGM